MESPLSGEAVRIKVVRELEYVNTKFRSLQVSRSCLETVQILESRDFVVCCL